MPDANQALGSIPFSSLIGGPLTAAIEAQAAAAVSSVKFITSVGFEQDGKVKTVSFTATRGNQSTTINVPLLTIVPIPFIRIDDMTIDFKSTITQSDASSEETTSSTAAQASLEGSVKYLFFSAKLSGSVSSKKDSRSTRDSKYAVEHCVDVHVHAVQDDMPAGMARMLSILTHTIEELPASTAKPGKPAKPADH